MNKARQNHLLLLRRDVFYNLAKEEKKMLQGDMTHFMEAFNSRYHNEEDFFCVFEIDDGSLVTFL